jgi:hypothetical protein
MKRILPLDALAEAEIAMGESTVAPSAGEHTRKPALDGNAHVAERVSDKNNTALHRPMVLGNMGTLFFGGFDYLRGGQFESTQREPAEESGFPLFAAEIVLGLHPGLNPWIRLFT